MSYYNKRLGTDSFPGRLNEARSATAANGGTALGTTVAVTSVMALPQKTTHYTLYPRNFTGANVLKFALNPFLIILVTGNNLQTSTDFSQAGQQNTGNGTFDATGVSLNNQDVFANGGAIYVGSHVPFRGVAVTNGNANTNASVLTVNYWNGAWTGVSGFTDGTSSGGKTQAQSGLVTWTVPTDWKAQFLSDTMPGNPNAQGWLSIPGANGVPAGPPVAPIMRDALIQPATSSSTVAATNPNQKTRFWTQWIVSAKLSATVNNTGMLSLNRSTAYAETEAKVFTQGRTFHAPDGIAAIEAIIDAGSGNLIITAYNDNELGNF